MAKVFDWQSIGLDFGNWEEEKIWALELPVITTGPQFYILFILTSGGKIMKLARSKGVKYIDIEVN